MTFTIRRSRPEDIVHIMDCDVKCFYRAWTPEEWELSAETNTILVASVFGTPVGFAVFVEDLDEEVFWVPKVAVKAVHRRKLAATLLLDEVKDTARRKGIKVLRTLVPESLLNPEDENNTISWLNFVGWKPDGIERGFYKILGQQEDGIKFVLHV